MENVKTAILVALSLITVSCAKSVDPAPESDGAIGNGSTAPTAVAPSHPGPAAEWLEIHEDFAPKIGGGIGDCDKPYRITINRDGQYLAGPCKKNGSFDTGRIEPDELKELERLALHFAGVDPGLRTDCDFHLHLGSDQVFMTLPPNANLKIKSYRPGSFEVCYHGGKDRAGPVSSYLRSLLKKYYPKD